MKSHAKFSRYRILALVFFAAVLLDPPQAANADVAKLPAAKSVGTYIEYLEGDLPIILTSGHDGDLKPSDIPTRTNGVTVRDMHTMDLTYMVAAEIRKATGRFPYVVVSHLSRSKMDPNRPLSEAVEVVGDDATKAWEAFHGSIEDAKAKAVAKFGFAFIVDIHGHGHEVKRLELGYGVNPEDLNKSDAVLDAAGPASSFTLGHTFKQDGAVKYSELLRGKGSIGDLYAKYGIPSVPSPNDPSPGKAKYFRGGYTVRSHADAKLAQKVDGLQIESHLEGVRDSATNRSKFAVATVKVLNEFLASRYDYLLLASGSK